MIERSFDAGFLNRILNHPAVYPYVCGEMTEPFDYAPIVRDLAHYILVAQYGAFIAFRLSPGIYQVHTQFLPEGRGTAYAAALEGRDFMFEQTPCTELQTMVPVGNLAAKKLAERVGFQLQKTEGQWLIKGSYVPLEHFILSTERWSEIK